ncbi:unnamed protein product [Dicrocoelium dendriticum]|nr:unnamed protein product [Dicrocoelium dendriticum]
MIYRSETEPRNLYFNLVIFNFTYNESHYYNCDEKPIVPEHLLRLPIEIRFQFAVDNHVRSGCTVLTNESFRGPISLNLTYSEHSQPSRLCVWAFERSDKFEFNELGQCVLSLSKSSQLPDMPSDRVSMRSVRFSSPKTELRADLRLCFIWI